MPKQQIRHRQQPETISYSANNKVSVKLNRGFIFRDIILRLQGAPTVTAGNNSAANTLAGDEWACIDTIRLVVNGTDIIREISGKNLWWLNYFLYGKSPQVMPQLGDGATANPVIDSYLTLPISMPGIRRPFDTVLDSRRMQSFTLEVIWKTFAAINASATAWSTEPTVEIYSLESFGVAVAPTQLRMFELITTITATNPKLKIDLNTGVTYRGILINTTDAGVDQGDILNNVKLKSGTTVFYDLPDNLIREYTRQRLGLEHGFSGSAYDDLRIGNANSQEGWYFIDLAPDGMLSEALDTVGFAELFLELDVTVGGGATLLTIIPMEMILPRGNPNK